MRVAASFVLPSIIKLSPHKEYCHNFRSELFSTMESATFNTRSIITLKTKEEKDSVIPSLAKLTAGTEMSTYGIEQWKYLLDAPNVEALVMPKYIDETSEDLVGCVLRVRYGPHSAYGMMLVSKDARGQGLAKKLLNAAMDDNSDLKILGTCTSLGTPMYEKMGFGRVSTVTKLKTTIQKNKNCTPNLSKNYRLVVGVSPNQLQSFLELDRSATGLDRSQTLRAIHMSPHVTTAVIESDGEVLIGAMITRYPSSVEASVGPMVGDERLVSVFMEGIMKQFSGAGVLEVSLIVSDHETLIRQMKSVGFETVFELGAMTMSKRSMPGDRASYLALIHPTLG